MMIAQHHDLSAEKDAWIDLSSSVPQQGQSKDLLTTTWWWKADTDAEEQHAQEAALSQGIGAAQRLTQL